MQLKFSKMQGLGNDFIVIDAVNQAVQLSADQIKQLADRHFGIGCDQLLLIEPSEQADFFYRIFNADGSEVEQCGNGARCVTRFVIEKQLHQGRQPIFQTIAGKLQTELLVDNLVVVDMGRPSFDSPVSILQGKDNFVFHRVSVGNPHAVLQVEDCEQAQVEALGNMLNNNPLFPEQVNVEFVEIVSPEEIRLRVYERHVGETLACGSGACAAVASGIEQGVFANKVLVKQPGGELMVSWTQDEGMKLVGPAEFVFEGEVSLASS